MITRAKAYTAAVASSDCCIGKFAARRSRSRSNPKSSRVRQASPSELHSRLINPLRPEIKRHISCNVSGAIADHCWNWSWDFDDAHTPSQDRTSALLKELHLASRNTNRLIKRPISHLLIDRSNRTCVESHLTTSIILRQADDDHMTDR